MLVYVATHSSGKRYVGMTAQPLKVRIAAHKCSARHLQTPFALAIAADGIESFAWEIVRRCETRHDAFREEQTAIVAYDTLAANGRGYNATRGGSGAAGYQWSDSQREAQRRASTGRPQSDDTRRRRSASLTGRTLSAEHVAKMRQRRASIETRQKIGAASRGRRHTDDTKAQIAESSRRARKTRDAPKLPMSSAASILERRRLGESYRSIANGYDCDPAAVFYAVRRWSCA